MKDMIKAAEKHTQRILDTMTAFVGSGDRICYGEDGNVTVNVK